MESQKTQFYDIDKVLTRKSYFAPPEFEPSLDV